MLFRNTRKSDVTNHAKYVNKNMPHYVGFFFVFFLNFWRTRVLFMGPLISLFWTSGDVCPGFQSQGGLTCMLSCLRAIPQIHLWCDTCQPLDGQHGSRATLTRKYVGQTYPQALVALRSEPWLEPMAWARARHIMLTFNKNTI